MKYLPVLLLLLATTAMANEQRRQLQTTDIRIEIKGTIDDGKAAELADWVQSAAKNVTFVYGRFPTDRLRVILQPSNRSWWDGGGAEAVYFGRTTRADGGTVELFINPDRPIDEFYGNWTATHEFSHLMLPLLDREHRWLSEGFATYYQNVLMARAGHYTPEYAWQRLAEGFERGAGSRPELSPNAAGHAGVRDARMKYYWAGAAFALLVDTELRSRSNGAESLDSVLGELEDCCLPARRRWTGPALMRRLDSFLDEPLFVEYWNHYADTPGFPDILDALNGAQNASIRAQIMQNDHS